MVRAAAFDCSAAFAILPQLNGHSFFEPVKDRS